MKSIIAGIFFMLALQAALSQEVRVQSVFDTSRIFIGDQINYTITIDKPLSYILTIPVFKDTIFSNIEILDGPVSDTSFLNDGRIRIIQKYLVTSFDSGYYLVPPVYAELRSEQGIKRFFSDYTPLHVMRVSITPPDTAKIFDIIQPYRVPLTAGEILPWILSGMLLVAFSWYIYNRLKRRSSKERGEPPPVIADPAHIIAFRELERLREEKLWQKGELKKYYTRLSEIIRQYIENRYGIYSLEMTTWETLDTISRKGLNDKQSYRLLQTVLTGSDLVKFAKYRPEPSENESNFQNAWDFVNSTKLIVTGQVGEKDVEKVKTESV